MLKLENWSKSYGSNKVLKDINLQVKEGQVLSIIGSSGSGKSTLLNTINFLNPADSGTISIADLKADVENISNDEILKIRRKTAMVFQNYALFSKKTALENVMENLLMVKELPENQAKDIASSFLEKVGMSDRMEYYPRQLSGGQQQRVGIARALAINPEVILLDEPTSSLDPEMSSEILDLIKSVAQENTTMILVTHEMHFAKEVSDSIIFLHEGKILEQGSPKQIFDNPREFRTSEFIQDFKSKQL